MKYHHNLTPPQVFNRKGPSGTGGGGTTFIGGGDGVGGGVWGDLKIG